MNKTINNILGVIIALAVLSVGYAAVRYVNYYGEMIQPSSFRSFSVTGDGKTTAMPDVAEFSFQVITEGSSDLTALQTKNTDATNKVLAFIKAQGIEDKDIKTQYYNVDPRYQTYDCRIEPVTSDATSGSGSVSVSGGAAISTLIAPVAAVAPVKTTATMQVCPPASIVGYTITQSVDVKIRDFSKIGNIMSGVVTNGVNQVGSLSFTIDDPSQAQNQARAQAIDKAKAKAEAIAQAGGFKIGRLLNIQEGSVYPMYNAPLMMTADAKSASGAAPSIQPGSQEVDITVTLQYEIK